jgi:hypothetical protein
MGLLLFRFCHARLVIPKETFVPRFVIPKESFASRLVIPKESFALRNDKRKHKNSCGMTTNKAYFKILH